MEKLQPECLFSAIFFFFLIPDCSMVISVEVWRLVLELGRVEVCQLLSSNFVIFKYKVVWSGGPKGGISKSRILME